jgi:RNA polymerase sigma-70 factor, ECF subfamily
MNTSARLILGAVASEPQPPPAATDELLASSGDAESFAQLYERYLPVVYRYVGAHTSTREEAEDLTSDAFRQVWTSRHTYSRLGSFQAWLFSIVRRTLADHYRRPRRPMTQLAPTIVAHVADDGPTPEEQVVQDERELHARRLLSDLGEEQREILSLRFAAELTYAEIAAVIGKREEAVKKIAYRTLQLLRERNFHD